MKFNRLLLPLLLTIAVPMFSTTTSASDGELEALKREIVRLNERVRQLEAKAAVPTETLISVTETQVVNAGDAEELPLISLSGVLEMEASYSDADESGSASDLAVATVELAADIRFSRQWQGQIIALYEEDGTDLDIDVASLNYASEVLPGWTLTAGQIYLPFGTFNTAMVNDSLVLEIGEIRETALVTGYAADHFRVLAYVFNGDADRGNDTLQNFGIDLAVQQGPLTVGAGYLSNVFDTDGISGWLQEEGFDLASMPEDASAWVLSVSLQFSGVTVYGESIATESFVLPGMRDRSLTATHLEASTEFGLWTLAVAWQETDDSDGLLPQERWSLGAARALNELLGLGVEFWQDKEYDGSDSSNLTLQVNASF